MFLYSVFVLPEALTPERREELMAANEATQEGNNGGAKASEQRNGQADGYGSDEDDESDEEDDSKLDVFSRRFNFFRKLAILLPARDANSGKRDYRLFVLAIAFTIYRIAGLYTNDVSRVLCLGLPSGAVLQGTNVSYESSCSSQRPARLASVAQKTAYSSGSLLLAR